MIRSELSAVAQTRRSSIAGRIRTVRCFEDNALIKTAMSEQSKGDVLVVDGGGSLRTALLGGQIAKSGSANGWAGANHLWCNTRLHCDR
ncbi:MAG: hypothetical protein M3O31_08035 [Acidobacteriota bacterium]|nr:hypothetical protein [Acidobacteriota bacterium]